MTKAIGRASDTAGYVTWVLLLGAIGLLVTASLAHGDIARVAELWTLPILLAGLATGAVSVVTGLFTAFGEDGDES